MSQRSPMNARYQKHTKPKGQTRKSAAAAKPKRSGTAPSTPSRTAKSRPTRPVLPPLPEEVKIWRYVWWGMLAGAIVFSLMAFWLRDQAPWNTVTLVIAYILIFGGLAIDFLKVRPARQAQLAEFQKGKSPVSKTKAKDAGTGSEPADSKQSAETEPNSDETDGK